MPDDNLTNTQQPMDVITPQIPLATVFGDEEGDEGVGEMSGVGSEGVGGGAEMSGNLPPLPTELTPAVSTPAAGGEGAGEAVVSNALPPLPSLDNLDAMIGSGEATTTGSEAGVTDAAAGSIVEPLPLPSSPMEAPATATSDENTAESVEKAGSTALPSEVSPAMEGTNEVLETTGDIGEENSASLPATLPTELSTESPSSEEPMVELPELTPTPTVGTPAVGSSPMAVPTGIESATTAQSAPVLADIPLTAEMPVPVIPTPEMAAAEGLVPATDMPLPSALPSLDNIEVPAVTEEVKSGAATELPVSVPSELPVTLPAEEMTGEVSNTAELPTAIPTLESEVTAEGGQTTVGDNNPPSLSSLGSINDLGSGNDEAEGDDGTPSLNEMLDQADQIGEETQVPALNNQATVPPQATKIITPAAGLMADIDVENLSKLSPVEIIDQQLAKVEDELTTLKTKASKLQQVNEELKKEIEQKQYSAQVIEYSLNSSMSRMNELEQQKQDLNAARAQVSGGGGQG